MGASTAVDQREPHEGASGEVRHERLGGARAEFVANLGRRAAELRAALKQLEADPGSEALQGELGRRLHALGAAARLLRFVKLADRLVEGEALLHGGGGAGLSGEAAAVLRRILDEMPALAWGQAAVKENLSGHGPIARGGAASPGRGVAPVRGRGEAMGAEARAERREARGDGSVGSAGGALDERGMPLTPLTALVVGREPLAEALMPGITDAGPVFEVERTENATTALDLVRVLAPDVVLLDTELPGARALVEALTADPLTEPVPILALGGFLRPEEAAPFVALGVARALIKPVSPNALRRAAAEVAATYVRREVIREPLGELTLDQLGARLAEELRRGLCDAANAKGRAVGVDMGEGAEVLAALWGAVARIRDLVTIRSQGAVRFSPSGPEGALPLAPWIGPPEGAEGARTQGRSEVRWGAALAGADHAEEAALEGVVAVVADDDPAVTWFLAGVLRAAGAVVHEAHDGARALDLAYQTTPDLVVSDVLMPHLDGFALCRALRRDVALRDVPVILLSWKEDLLQRLRELGADADGYLRKEASAAAIVQRVREVLRPRRRVAERIAAGGEVRGRLDGMTTRTLLSLACAHRPTSIVSVRDAAFLYEVELRDGRPAAATRTAPDGTFQRGPVVLASMLGVGSGRFVVSPAPDSEVHAQVRGGFEGSLGEQLLPWIAAVRAAQRLLSGSALVQVERVNVDETRMSAYAGATPEPARSLLRRLIGGASPRMMITSGQVAPRLLEDVLCDAAAHGSVMAVLDRSGADLLAPAAASEMDLLRGQHRMLPPPTPELVAGQRLDEPASLDEAFARMEWQNEPALLDEAFARMESRTPGPVALGVEASVAGAAFAEDEALPLIEGRAEAVPLPPIAPEPPVAPEERSAEHRALSSIAEDPGGLGATPLPGETAALGDAPAVGVLKPGPMMTLGSLTPPPVLEPQAIAFAGAAPALGAIALTAAELRATALDESPVPRRMKRPSAYAPSSHPPAPAKESRVTVWVLFAVAAFVFAVGARLSRGRELHAAAPPPAPSALSPAAAGSASEPASSAAPAGPAGESAANPVLPEDLPIPAGETVPEGQGLLQVIAGPNDAISVDERAVGTGTVKMSLAPKADAYAIRVKLRGEERVRFALVKAGRMTRLRVAPPWRR